MGALHFLADMLKRCGEDVPPSRYADVQVIAVVELRFWVQMVVG